MLYHNVTPSYFFESYDLRMAHYLKKGRQELYSIKDKFNLNLAVSNFNKIELERIGFRYVDVFPIQLDLNHLIKYPKKDLKKIDLTLAINSRL